MSKERDFHNFCEQHEGVDPRTVSAFYLNALVGAVNRASDAHVREMRAQTKDIGKWLGAIRTEIKNIQLPPSEKIAELTEQLDTGSSSLNESVEANQPK